MRATRVRQDSTVPQEHIHYSYDSTWLDQMTGYGTIDYVNGVPQTEVAVQDYTYDNQGNPTTITNFYYNGDYYDHADLAYDGRQLTEIIVYDVGYDEVVTISYTYNDQGYRTSKTIDNGVPVTINYTLSGDKVIYETDGTYGIVYTYDYNGKIISFNYDININDSTDGIEYFYLRNQQGDISKILDKDGNVEVEYKYDAWGNILDIEDHSGQEEVSYINQYLYRGYRYDNEIKLYYLNSRFYNPVVGRFINADSLLGDPGSILCNNGYGYTSNNPINRTDDSGYKWNWKKFWTGVAATVVAVAVVTAVIITAPVSIPIATVAIIIGSTAATGAALTVASASETTAVLDFSGSANLPLPIPTPGVQGGLSLIIDFKGGNIELYGHAGGNMGVGGGASYGAGLVNNYDGENSYGGPFVNGGGSFGIVGYDHCYDPRKDHDNAVSANTLRFGPEAGYAVGYEEYESIFHWNWGD